jgi:hypothetical protein
MYLLLQLLDPRFSRVKVGDDRSGDGYLARLPKIQLRIGRGRRIGLSLGDLGAGAVYLADKANETLASAGSAFPRTRSLTNGALEDAAEA